VVEKFKVSGTYGKVEVRHYWVQAASNFIHVQVTQRATKKEDSDDRIRTDHFLWETLL
jgi:hypothetical protein